MVKQLDRIPASICEYIVEVWASDGDPLNAVAALSGAGVHLEDMNSSTRKAGEIPEAVQTLVDELMVVKKQLDFLSDREKEIKNSLLVAMSNLNEDKWANDLIQISKKAAYLRESIDTKALKTDAPEIYAKYKKETKVSESLTYKIL
jgi:predicted phage-related endonuclease